MKNHRQSNRDVLVAVMLGWRTWRAEWRRRFTGMRAQSRLTDGARVGLVDKCSVVRCKSDWRSRGGPRCAICPRTTCSDVQLPSSFPPHSNTSASTLVPRRCSEIIWLCSAAFTDPTTKQSWYCKRVWPTVLHLKASTPMPRYCSERF